MPSKVLSPPTRAGISRKNAPGRGGLLGTSAGAHARECASRLRALAAAIGTESLGTQWRSPAKDRCEAQLWEMENEVRVVARKLELWAETEGSRSLLAELL